MASKKRQLNNLHILALFMYRNGGQCKQYQARQALIKHRFGRVTKENRDWYPAYFSRRQGFVSGSPYAIPGRRQLWEPVDPIPKDWVYRGTWRLTGAGIAKALEAIEILEARCHCRIGRAYPVLTRCKITAD